MVCTVLLHILSCAAPERDLGERWLSSSGSRHNLIPVTWGWKADGKYGIMKWLLLFTKFSSHTACSGGQEGDNSSFSPVREAGGGIHTHKRILCLDHQTLQLYRRVYFSAALQPQRDHFEILYCHHGKHLHRKVNTPPVPRNDAVHRGFLSGLWKELVCLMRPGLQGRTPENSSPEAHAVFVMTALGWSEVLAHTDQSRRAVFWNGWVKLMGSAALKWSAVCRETFVSGECRNMVVRISCEGEKQSSQPHVIQLHHF